MSSRRMSLLPQATLRSDSEHLPQQGAAGSQFSSGEFSLKTLEDSLGLKGKIM
jgi:hypothetical protein